MDSATENDSHFAIASGGEAEIMQVGDENPDAQIRVQNSHLQNLPLDCRLQGNRHPQDNRRGERGYVHIIFVLFTILGVALWGVSESLRDATKTQLNIEKKSVANLQRARRAIINYVAIPPGPRPDTLPGGDFVNFYDNNNTPTNLNDDRRQVFTEFLLPCPDNLGFLNDDNFRGGDGFAPDRNPDQGRRDDYQDSDFDGSADFNPRNPGNPVGFCGDQTTSIGDVTRGVMRDGSRFGRLPWREVDLGAMRYVRGLGGVDYRDGYDGRLWYALSLNNTRTFSKALQRRGGVNSIAPLNPHRLLRLYEDWLVVRDLYGNVISDRVAAVVLSPGANFGQSRPFETFYPWFPAGGPTVGFALNFRGPHFFGTNASLYFEEGNEDADGVFVTPHAILEGTNISLPNIGNLSAYRRTASEDQLAFITAEDLAAPGSEPIRILEDENSPRHIYSRLDGEQFGQTGIVQILEGFFARNGFLPDPAMFIEAHGESLVRNIPVRRARVLQPGEINAITVSGARVGGASQTFNSAAVSLSVAVINVANNPDPVTLTIRRPVSVTVALSLSYSENNPAETTILLLTVYAETGTNPAVAPLTVVEVDLDASGPGNGLVPLLTFPQRIFAAGREVELFDESLAPELPRLILSSARLPPVYLASRIDTEGIQAEGVAESNVPFNIIAVNLENSLNNQTLPSYDCTPPVPAERERPAGSPAASFASPFDDLSCELPPGEVATATNIQLLVERTHYVRVLEGSYTVRLAAPAAVPVDVPSRDIEFQDGSSDPTAARGGAGVLLPEGTLLTFTVGMGEQISLRIPAGFRINDAGAVPLGSNNCLSPGANVPRRCSLPFGPAPFEFVFDVSRVRIIDGNPVVLPGIDFEINQVPADPGLEQGILDVVENAAAVPGQVGFLPVTSLDAEAARLNIDITRYPLTHRISLAAGGIGYFPTSVRISTPSGVQNAPIVQPHYPGDWTVPRPGAVSGENSIFPRSRNNLAWATEMQLEGGEITLPPETRFVIPQSTSDTVSFVNLGTDFRLPPGAIALLPPDFTLPSVSILGGGRLPDGTNVPGSGVVMRENVFLPLGAAMVFPRGGELARGIFFPSAGQAGFQLEVALDSQIFNGNNPVGTVTEDGSLFYPFRGEELRPTAITIAALPDPGLTSSRTSELVSFSWTRGGLLAAPQRYRWRGLELGSRIHAESGEAEGRTSSTYCNEITISGTTFLTPFCVRFLQRQDPDNPTDGGFPNFAQRPFLYHDLNYVPGEVGLNTRVTATVGAGAALTITLNEGFRFLLPPGATVQVQRRHAAVAVDHDNFEGSLGGAGDFGYRQYICQGGKATCGFFNSPLNYPANLMAFVQNRAEFSSPIQQHGFAALDDVVREDAVNQVVLPAGTAVYPPGQEGDGSAPPFPILSAPLTVPLLNTVSLPNQGMVILVGTRRETRGAGSLQSQMVLWPDSDMLYRPDPGNLPETAIPGGSLINLTQGRATPPLGRAKIRAFAEDGSISYGGPMIGFVQRDTSLAINDFRDPLAGNRELRGGFYTISNRGRPVRVWNVGGARPVEQALTLDVGGGVTVHYPTVFINSPLKLPKGAIVYVPGGRELAVLMTSHDTGNFPANSDRSVIPVGSYAYIPRGTTITITAASGSLNATANGQPLSYSTGGSTVPGPAVVDLANFAFRGLPYIADVVGGNVTIVGRGDFDSATENSNTEVVIRGADPEWNPSNIEFFAHAPGAAIRNNRAVRLLRANQDFDVLGNAVYRGENTFFTEQLPPALGTFAENYPLVYAVAGECRRFNDPSPDCAQGANEGLLLTLRARATVSLPEDYAVPGNTLIRAESPGPITLTINYPAVDVTQGQLSGRIGRRTEILEVNWLAFGNDGSGLVELSDGTGTTRQINTAGAEPISVVIPPPTGGRLEVAIGLPSSAVTNSLVMITAGIRVGTNDIATTVTIPAALTSVDVSAIPDSIPRAYPSILSGGVRVGVPVTVNIGGFTGDNRINDQCLEDLTGRGASCPAHPLIIRPAVGFSVGAGTRLEVTDTPGIFGVGGVYITPDSVTISLDNYALVNARSAAYGLTAAANIVTFAADGAPGAVAAGQVLEVDLSADRGGFMLDTDCTGDNECTRITMNPGYTWEGYIQGVVTLGYNTKPDAGGGGAAHPLADQGPKTITVGTSSESSWTFRREFFARQYPDDLDLGFGGHGTVTTTIQIGGGPQPNIGTETPAQMVGTLQVAVCTSLALQSGDCPDTATNVTVTVRHQGGFSFVRHFPGPAPGFEPMTATVSNYGFCSQITDDGNPNYGMLDDCYHPTFNQRLNVLDGGGDSTVTIAAVRLQNAVIPISNNDAPHYLANINVADGTGQLTLSAFFEGNSQCSDALLPVATVGISVAVTVTIGDQPPRETDSVYSTLADDNARANEHSFVVADAQIVLDRTYSPTLATGENLQVLVPGRSFDKFEGYAAIYQPIGSSVDMRRDTSGAPIGLFPQSRSIASRVRSAAWRDFFGGDLNAANDSGFTQAEAQRASYAVEAGYFHILNAPDDDDYGVFFMVPEPVINVMRARRDDSATFVVGSGDTNTTIPSLPGFTNAGAPAYLPSGLTVITRADYYLDGETAPDPDGAISENVEIYAGSIINMRTGQVIPSRRLVDGSVILGQEGARVGINGGNARVPLPIVDTIEDIVTLTMNTQGSIPDRPRGVLATIDATPDTVNPDTLGSGNSEPLRDVCKIWIFPELKVAETNLQSLYDIQVEIAFLNLVKRWAGPAAEQIPMENLARMVNANDPPLTLVINLERDITLDSGVQVEAGAPVDFEFEINRQTRRGGGNFNAVNSYDVFRITTGGPPLTLPKSGRLIISVLTGQTAVTLQHRRRSTHSDAPNPPVDIIYTLTEGPMDPNMMHMVDTVTISRTVRRQDHDAGVNVFRSEQRRVTPYVFTVRIDRRPRGLLVVGGDLEGYRLSEYGASEPDASVFGGDGGRALYIPYLRPEPVIPPSARMTIRYVSDQPTFGNRSLRFQLDRHCSLGNLQSSPNVRLFNFFDRTADGPETDLAQGFAAANPSMGCIFDPFTTHFIDVAPRTARDSPQFENNVIVVSDEDFYGTGRVTVSLYTVAEFVVENTYDIAHVEGPLTNENFYPPVIRFRRGLRRDGKHQRSMRGHPRRHLSAGCERRV